ncbi:MAG: DUF934 domain-containing protein [Betaproteobacteria bacterium]|nr:DUF934 domain-containing protein [Betaproteobacteria bacterium]
MSERHIILDGAIVADEWTLLAADHQGALPAGKLIVPLAQWLARRDEFIERAALHDLPWGVWLEGDEDPAQLTGDLARLALIAIHFPKFADGRGYSTAYLLRSRHGFKGELRAIGDVLRDQVFYLKRAGFNSFAIRADKPVKDALNALKDFSEPYQGSVDEARPLFRRARRGEVVA